MRSAAAKSILGALAIVAVAAVALWHVLMTGGAVDIFVTHLFK